MLYLIIGEGFSGILASQAIDTCRHLSKIRATPVKLLVFISIRDFKKQKKRFKAAYANTWVLPMFPKLIFWRMNFPLTLLSVLWSGAKVGVGRNPIATNLLLSIKKWGFLKKVIYDARGAYAAEMQEYQLVDHTAFLEKSASLEANSIKKSDQRIAVSNALVQHWHQQYQFENGNSTFIIPCTLNEAFLNTFPSVDKLAQLRNKYDFKENDIVLVYAGSTARWQSLEQLDEILLKLMSAQERVKMLFLAKLDLETLKVYQKFPEKIKKDWVKHNEVFDVMSMCDYGLLLRNDSITNRVAAPTKFAEYLACGLKVIISPGIGDYSAMVEKQGLGIVYSNASVSFPLLEKPPYVEKQKINTFGKERFSKINYYNTYTQLIQENNANG